MSILTYYELGEYRQKVILSQIVLTKIKKKRKIEKKETHREIEKTKDEIKKMIKINEIK